MGLWVCDRIPSFLDIFSILNIILVSYERYKTSIAQRRERQHVKVGEQMNVLLEHVIDLRNGSDGYSKTPWEKNRLHTYRPSLCH